MIIGSVVELNRYPVKSLAGERLDKECRIENYGLYGDRWHAFTDETKTGWDSFVTARGFPEMLTYRAEVVEAGGEDEFAHVVVTTPDGRKLHWNEELLREIQALTPKKLTMRNYAEENTELMGVDDSPILIVTDRSIRNLEAKWGKPVDPLRFRANLLVNLDAEAADELEWIGRELSIGSATLRIDKGCERCSLITLDPDTQQRDPSLLKIVTQELDQIFGVYATVVTPGQIAIGDKLRFI